MSEAGLPEGVEGEAADSVRLSSDLAASHALTLAGKTRRGRDVAAAFLTSHKEFIDLQASYVHEEQAIARRAAHLKRISDILRIVAQGAFIVVGLAVASGVVAMWWNAISSNAVIVDTFESPPSLTASGLGSRVVAGKVLDGLLKIQDDTKFAAVRQKIEGAWSNAIELKLPEAGISIDQISSALHRAFGHDLHIDGALVAGADGALSLSVRGDGIPPTTFARREDDIDGLTQRAAEYIYGYAQPALYAGYLIGAGRSSDCLSFIRTVLPRTRDADRAVLANLWGEALLNLNEAVEAENRFHFALRVDPHYWRAWNNLIGVLRQTRGEEAAYQSGMAMRKLADSVWFGPKPTPYDQTNFAELRMDPGTVIAGLTADRRLAQREGAEYDASSWIAEQEAVRHDWIAVKVYLAESPPNDATTPFDVQGLGGQQALEAGHYAAAVGMFEAAAALWHASPQLQAFFPDFECVVGQAYVAAGQAAKALELVKDGKFVRCGALQADALDAAGQWQAAQAAYRAAEAAAPNLSFAYYREGLARLRHDDFAGGMRQLEVANRLSPAWADPLKALGDASAARKLWSEAQKYYERALRFAPRLGGAAERPRRRGGEDPGPGRACGAAAAFMIPRRSPDVDAGSADRVGLHIAIEKFVYENGVGSVGHGLSNIRLEFESPSILSVLGPSGSGKTTFLNLIMGLLPLPAGATVQYSLRNARWTAPDIRSLGTMGTLAAADALLPWKTALQNILLPSRLNRNLRAPARQHINQLLRRLNLPDDALDCHPRELSNGMRRRISLLAALIYRPRFVFLDEPFESLDMKNGILISRLISEYVREEAAVAIVATHNVPIAHEISTHVGFINAAGNLTLYPRDYSVEALVALYP